MRAVRRRRIGLGAAVVGLVLPALLASTAVAVDPLPTPTPSAGTIGAPAGLPTPTPIPPPSGSTIGGPRMAEHGIVAAPGAPAVPGTTAAAWVVADAETGQVLAAKNPHGKYRPASTLKTLLALTMAPRLDPNSTVVADKSDENQEGTRVGMIAPQAYKVDDLWYGLLLRSGNDAANALARAGGGTVERGIRMMQAEAQRLQALDTTVVNPSGLDADGQFSSAYDLALWGRAALERRDLRKYVSSLRHTFPGNHTATATKQNSKDFWVYTENRLILRGFEGAIGVKTGYTTLAQNTHHRRRRAQRPHHHRLADVHPVRPDHRRGRCAAQLRLPGGRGHRAGRPAGRAHHVLDRLPGGRGLRLRRLEPGPGAGQAQERRKELGRRAPASTPRRSRTASRCAGRRSPARPWSLSWCSSSRRGSWPTRGATAATAPTGSDPPSARGRRLPQVGGPNAKSTTGRHTPSAPCSKRLNPVTGNRASNWASFSNAWDRASSAMSCATVTCGW